MTEWYIKVSGAGSALGHVSADSVKNPLTSASGDKVWYKAATMTKPTPGAGQQLTGPVYDVDNGTITYSTETVPVTVADVQAERDRRLALGFLYNFGDARGVHAIGTTEKDMKAWDREVTPYANALVNTNDTVTTIDIVTETGPCSVTGAEWQSILIAAGDARQPIWAAYFTLKTMDPIPSDYTDDRHWT